MPSRLLLTAADGGGAQPTEYLMIYNGQTGDGTVQLGRAVSSGGSLFTRDLANNPVLTPGTPGAWDDGQVHGASLLHDGSQYVLFFGGYDGANYRIGRATSPDGITWTKDGSNPVLDLGTAGAFDDNGVVGPTVVREDATTWHMWYTGFKAGGRTSVGYASSSDGQTWTKHGQMFQGGAPGEFDDEGVGTGPAIKVGATWYVYFGGQGVAPVGVESADYRTGYMTCTDPSDSGTYTDGGVLAAFAGTVTVGGVEYGSNQLRSIVAVGTSYLAWGTAFQPGDRFEEVSFVCTGTSPIDFSPPQACLGLGFTWDTVSAENPAVIAAQ